MSSQDEHKAIWDDTAKLQEHPPLAGDEQVDVAIVGAGITGLTAARLLVAKGKRVVVLEQHRVGSGTTGGTTAHVTQVPDRRYRELISKFGQSAMQEVVASTRAALEQVASLVEDDDIACDFARVPAYLYSESHKEVSRLEEEVEAACSVGVPASLVHDLPLPFTTAAGVLYEAQARFHPLQYLDGLVRAVTAAGGRIHENTRVLEVEGKDPCRVRTEHGTVTADRVLFATHTPAGFSLIHAEIEPLRSYAMAVRLRGQEPPDGLFFDTADPYHYTRQQPTAKGPVLIVGGADHKTGAGDPEASYRKLESYVRDRWRVESIENRWSAQFYEPPDGLPLIGESLSSPAVLVATGFSGTGMVFGTLAGMLMADLALGRSNPWLDLYKPSRFKPLASGPHVAKLNLETAAAFVGDRFEVPSVEALSEVPVGEGRVVQMGGKKVAVYREESGAVHAVSPVCTHAGCIVHWNAAEKSWDCPCHGGRYQPDGKVLEGPPVKDLEPVPVAELTGAGRR
jgi:glycine/D-amino acid oxidase-like deaminating enzyme/nitrite reductase/ring-hydroxylating ferredoxin subunit